MKANKNHRNEKCASESTKVHREKHDLRPQAWGRASLSPSLALCLRVSLFLLRTCAMEMTLTTQGICEGLMT